MLDGAHFKNFIHLPNKGQKITPGGFFIIFYQSTFFY